jgi:LPXTG-site transpeptidase (sortase) family protein
MGLALALLGLLLLGAEGAYLAAVEYSRGRVGDVVVTTPLGLPQPQDLSGPQTVSASPPAPSAPHEAAALGPLELRIPERPTSTASPKPSGAQDATAPTTAEPPAAPATRGGYTSLVDAASYTDVWDEAAGEFPVDYTAIAREFRPVDWAALPEQAAPPTRLRIPALGLDARVQGLRILDLGDARAYETPDNVVGHIPESGAPGARGNVWLFGHLESPVRGEGSIFRNLPKVYDLLQQGQAVYVIADSADGSFLYQVSEFRKVPEEDMSLQRSEEPLLTMVTCWPRLKYDERILVTAELVGVR